VDSNLFSDHWLIIEGGQDEGVFCMRREGR
jgi:hypothetical protein